MHEEWTCVDPDPGLDELDPLNIFVLSPVGDVMDRRNWGVMDCANLENFGF